MYIKCVGINAKSFGWDQYFRSKLQYKWAMQKCHQQTTEIPFELHWFQMYLK